MKIGMRYSHPKETRGKNKKTAIKRVIPAKTYMYTRVFPTSCAFFSVPKECASGLCCIYVYFYGYLVKQ